MHVSILLPHYKTWKMSFYAIHQLLKHRGRHQLDIWVVDNNPTDGTAKNLEFFGDQIKMVPYPTDRLQSHGIAYDYIVPRLRTELFVTIESDSFPTDDLWLDWYEKLAEQGYESAGSCLDLSGGQFVHTAGAFYKKSLWQKCKRYVDECQYYYLPNAAMKEGFACHLMVHQSMWDKFKADPTQFIALSPEYYNQTLPAYFERQSERYRPIVKGVFHNCIGNRDESYYTYAERNSSIQGERNYIMLDNTKPFLWRLGMEPGQYFHYWLLANQHPVFSIDTEVVWMPGREKQQQLYTKMQNGFTHLWAITAYSDVTDPSLKDIINHKKNQMEELYNSIPANERI